MRSRPSLSRLLLWLVFGIPDPLEVLAREHHLPWLGRGVRCLANGNRAVIVGARRNRVLVRLVDGRQLEVPPDQLQPR